MTTYFSTDEGKQDIALYNSNFAFSCNGQQLSDFHVMVEGYLACGYTTLFFSAYIFTLYRRKILLRTSMPIQDYYTLNYKQFDGQFVAKCLIRILLTIPVLCILAIPFILFDIETFPENAITL